MASGDSRIDKPQCGHPKRAVLLDVNTVPLKKYTDGTNAAKSHRRRLVFSRRCKLFEWDCIKTGAQSINTERVSLKYCMYNDLSLQTQSYCYLYCSFHVVELTVHEA